MESSSLTKIFHVSVNIVRKKWNRYFHHYGHLYLCCSLTIFLLGNFYKFRTHRTSQLKKLIIFIEFRMNEINKTHYTNANDARIQNIFRSSQSKFEKLLISIDEKYEWNALIFTNFFREIKFKKSFKIWFHDFFRENNFK